MTESYAPYKTIFYYCANCEEITQYSLDNEIDIKLFTPICNGCRISSKEHKENIDIKMKALERAHQFYKEVNTSLHRFEKAEKDGKTWRDKMEEIESTEDKS